MILDMKSNVKGGLIKEFIIEIILIYFYGII